MMNAFPTKSNIFGFATDVPFCASVHRPHASSCRHIGCTISATARASTHCESPTAGGAASERQLRDHETYSDGTADCRVVDGQKQCVLSQAQGNGQTGQRTFAIELRTHSDSRTEGTILMPFGSSSMRTRSPSSTTKILGKGLSFSTCVLLPVAGLVPDGRDRRDEEGHETHRPLAQPVHGDAVNFNLSLNGFSAALDRISQLGR